MSFAEWLKSMGAEPEDTAASDPIPTLTSGDVAVTSLAEPSTAVLEVRQRVQSALREKPRERVAESAAAGPGVSTATAMGGTFVAGLLLGALAMKRQRLRARAE
jgi:predicted lipid-binding transport protein (Tim44 family)